jgi:hypothetical protein
MYKTHLPVRFTTGSEVRQFLNYVVKYQVLASHINQDQTSIEYIRITVSGICC